jgi:opacity protein-like surface antigen
MKQVALLTAAAALMAGSTFAIDGAYLGVQGGYQSINNKQSGNAAGVGFSDTHNVSGGVLGLYGGYGKSFSNHVYLGGELEANGSSAHSDRGMGAVPSKFKQDYNYGASARLGYNMNDCLMPYVRVGFNRAKFEQNGGGIDDSQTKTGPSVGVGAEYHLAKNLGVRGELVNTYYGRMDSSAAGSSSDSKLNDRQARIGLAYYF